jgi:hypothetical protein
MALTDPKPYTVEEVSVMGAVDGLHAVTISRFLATVEALGAAVAERDAAQSRIDRAIHIIDHGKNFIMSRVREVLSGAPKGKDQEPLVRPNALKTERDRLAAAMAGERDSALAREARLREALETARRAIEVLGAGIDPEAPRHSEERRILDVSEDELARIEAALSDTSLTADAWRKQIEDGARRAALEEAADVLDECIDYDHVGAHEAILIGIRSCLQSMSETSALSTPPTQAEEPDRE